MLKKQKIVLFLIIGLIIGLSSFIFFAKAAEKTIPSGWSPVTSCDDRLTECTPGKRWNPAYWYVNNNTGMLWCINHPDPFPPEPDYSAPPLPPPNSAPFATSLSVSQSNYCKAGPAMISSWTFSDPDAGDTQSAYQVQVATNPGFSAPGTVVDSGKVSSASNSYTTGSGKLAYNTTYYWRVKVWDNHDLVSDWSSGSAFATPKHVYPTVNFKAAPASPSVNETVQLTDLTTGGDAIVSWLWNITDAAYQDGTTANSQNPKVKFTSAGTKPIILVAKDADNYQCANTDTASSQQNIKIMLPLPGWKEVE